MRHVYTFGKSSIQFLIMTPEEAALMNKFETAFFEAQEHFLQKHGRRWTPDEPIAFNGKNWTAKNNVDHSLLVRKLNRQHAVRNKLFDFLRINVSNEDLGDDLIKRI